MYDAFTEGISGNERADVLANFGLSVQYDGTSTRRWRLHPGLRMSRMVLQSPSSRVAYDLLSLSRSVSSQIVGLITGHGLLRKHLPTVGILQEGPVMSARNECGEQFLRATVDAVLNTPVPSTDTDATSVASCPGSSVRCVGKSSNRSTTWSYIVGDMLSNKYSRPTANLNVASVHVLACCGVSVHAVTCLPSVADGLASTHMLLTPDIYARLLGSAFASARTSVGLTFNCPRCGNTYARPHSLSRHIRFECGVDPKFECPICHKKSKHKHNLMLHMRTHQNR
ncbi:hypothetical protein J6590_002312 [Homalodisca vitripennis]|nr:hypothetical protein J6590_002312 [Homalodisca vitripennis]